MTVNINFYMKCHFRDRASYFIMQNDEDKLFHWNDMHCWTICNKTRNFYKKINRFSFILLSLKLYTSMIMQESWFWLATSAHPTVFSAALLMSCQSQLITAVMYQVTSSPASSLPLKSPFLLHKHVRCHPDPFNWSSPFCLVAKGFAHTKMNIPIIYMLFQHLSIKKVTVQIHSCMCVFKLCSSVNEKII